MRENKFLGILIFIFLLSGSIPITQFVGVARPDPVFYWDGEPFRPIGFNYYPSTHPWEGTWTEFNLTELNQDFIRIKALGGNCIRTFIQWRQIEPNEGEYNNTIVNRIIDLFQAASSHDIAIMFSFFDFGPPAWAHAEPEQMYINQSLIAKEIAQLEYLIPLINETKAAFIWDLRNEPTSSTISMAQFRIWVENLTTAIRNLGDTHYIVVGGGYGNFENPAGYADLVDAVCMHFYRARDSPTWKREFEIYTRMFRQSQKPIILQEFGWPTGESWGISESVQATYYKGIFELCDKEQIAGVMPWCLWDYPYLTWSETEGHFGVLRADGSWKPAAHVFHAYVTGSRMNSWNLDWDWRF